MDVPRVETRWRTLTVPNRRGLSSWWFGTQWRVVHPDHSGYLTAIHLGAGHAAPWTHPGRSARPLRGRCELAAVVAGRHGLRPDSAARLRDRVEGSRLSRRMKEEAHHVLGLTGLGDTLLAWESK